MGFIEELARDAAKELARGRVAPPFAVALVRKVEDPDAALNQVIEYCSRKWEGYEKTWHRVTVVFVAVSVALILASLLSASYVSVAQAVVVPMIYYAARRKEMYSNKILALKVLPLLPREKRIEFLTEVVENYLVYKGKGEEAGLNIYARVSE